MATIRIKNGTIIDPLSGKRTQGDLLTQGAFIESIGAPGEEEAKFTVDAADCIVLPGLIDSHCHLYPFIKNGSPAEALCLPSGVTAAADAGSTGFATYELMSGFIDNAYVTEKLWLHVCPTGLSSLPVLEDVDPSHMNFEGIRETVSKHRDRIVGLKLRTSAPIVKEFGWEPLKKMISMAEKLNLPVMVHSTNPPGPFEELLAMLRPGDVLTHMYQNTGYCILDSSRQHIMKAAWEARERGVLFEAADARVHFSFECAKVGIREGFYPDFIGTDSTILSMYHKPTAFNMAMQLNKYLSLGLPEEAAFRAVTSNTAKLLGLLPERGQLIPGAVADIAVFKKTDIDTVFGDRPYYDDTRTELKGKIALKPVMTVKNGNFVYRDMEF